MQSFFNIFDSVVDDNYFVVFLFHLCAYRYDSFITDTDAVLYGILDYRLNRQGRYAEGIVIYVISHTDIMKAYHFNICVYFCMLQFLLYRYQIRLAERINILPQVHPELLGSVKGFFGVDAAKHLNGGKCVIQEMGLYLRHHYLYSLLRHKSTLMLTDKPQVQPYIIEQASAGNGYREI